VRTPDGRVAYDESGRLPGRGAYVCRDDACRARASSKGVLGRALGVALPAEIRDALAGAGTAREARIHSAPDDGGGTAPAAPDTMTMTMPTTNEGGAGGQE